MPLPVFFIGAAVATGGAGVVKSVKAGIDARTATKMNEDANALVESTTARLNAHLESCGTALSNLGEEKVFVLENSMKTFLDTFTTSRKQRVFQSSLRCALMRKSSTSSSPW